MASKWAKACDHWVGGKTFGNILPCIHIHYSDWQILHLAQLVIIAIVILGKQICFLGSFDFVID